MKQVQGATDALNNVFPALLNDMEELVNLAGAKADFRGAGSEAVVESIKNVLRLSWLLREHIGEGIASSDFQIICPSPNASFDPKQMDNAYCRRGDNTRWKASSHVVFVTELGAMRREKLSNPTPGQESISSSISVKAAVVLSTSITQLRVA